MKSNILYKIAIITSALLSLILAINYFFGIFILSNIIFTVKLDFMVKVVGVLYILTSNLSYVGIGVIFLFLVRKYPLNMWIWVLFGFTTGKFALILFILKNQFENNFDKKIIKKIVFLLLCFLLIEILSNLLFKLKGNNIFGDEYNMIYALSKSITTIRYVIFYVSNIGVSVWCFLLAKQYRVTPLLWIILALISGLIAPILFLLINNRLIKSPR